MAAFLSLSRRALPFVLLLLLAARGRAEPGGADELPISVTRLGERVIVLDCLGVNVTAIAADSGLVVIDTGRSPGLMRACAAVIAREFGRSDFRYVVNTHGHWDHCSGNQALPGATIVGHATCPEFMRHHRADALRTRLSLRQRIARVEADGGAAGRTAAPAAPAAAELRALRLALADLEGGYVPTPPTLTFADSLTLDLGDLTLELGFAGPAHTDSDILVYVPRERLLVAGDLICSATALCFDVDPLNDGRRLADRLGRLLADAAGPATVVPGHGSPFGREDLLRLRATLVQARADMAEEVGRSGAALVADVLDTAGVEPALALYGRLIRDEGGSRRFTAEDVHRLAERLRCRGQVEASRRMLDAALVRFPASPLLHDSLGNVRLELGDTTAALASYRRSLALLPENRSAAMMIEALAH